MMKSVNLLVVLGIGLGLAGCGESESPASSSGDGKPNATSKRKQAAPEESAQHVDIGTRSLDEAISQSVAESGSIQVDCVSNTLSTHILELKNSIPRYEKFVQHFHENKSDIRFFSREAQAAPSKGLQNKFTSYLEAKMNGLMQADSNKFAEIENEIEKSKSAFASVNKLRKISSKVFEKSHEGIENFANMKSAITACLNEVNNVLKKEFDLTNGNEITHAIDALNAVRIGTMTLKSALVAGDEYLNGAVEQLKVATEKLMRAYDKLVPGYFAQMK